MDRRIKITAVANEQPDVRLYVLALIALARHLQNEEESATESDSGPGTAEVDRA